MPRSLASARSTSASWDRSTYAFGLGLGLFYASQGVGRAVAAMNANAVRMLVNASGGLIAIWWLDLGPVGFFAAVAAGFCLYAALLVRAVTRVKAPDSTLAMTS
jgi:hypothetical protein